MDTVKVKERGMVKFIAHRGLSGIETENTLAAFVAAGNRDYFGVETDVHVTADGHFAILHDDETGRVCDTNIPVEKSEFAQLRALSMKEAGGGYSDVQRIPSLAEYLRVLKRYGKIAVLELKNAMHAEDIGQIMRICADEYGLDNLIFISFCYENLTAVLEKRPEQKVQYLTGEYSEDMPAKLGAAGMGVDIWYGALTQERVKKFHDAGVTVNCYTCDDARDAVRLALWGVDMITTNILQ